MIFTDLVFFPFFIIVLVVANLILKDKQQYRKLFLLIASFYFYASWNWKLAFLVIFSTSIDYLCALKMDSATNPSIAKRFLLISIISNLTILGFFKYFNFFMDNVSFILGENFKHWNILLPIGISFYTFEAMSYVIDVYHKKISAEKSYINFGFFIIFFPKLVAGPILRAYEFLPQVHNYVNATKQDIEIGIQVFVQGIIKKVILADTVAIFADAIFGNPSPYNSATIWLAVIAYAIQIFCDFSGYTDMAIGTAKMLGYDLVKNFDMPYVSTTVTEFWKRWHISLSRWIKDYIYIPLGGNRLGRIRTYINLLVTMLLGGLWHGASWNFVIWGGMHGLALSIDKYLKLPELLEKYKILKPLFWFITLIFILVTWVFFRAQNFGTAFLMLRKMFLFTDGGMQYYQPLTYIIPFVVMAHLIGKFYLEKNSKDYYYFDLESFIGILVLLITILLIIALLPVSTSRFIYFQF